MQVDDGGATLLWPDYIGNWMFNTLGAHTLRMSEMRSAAVNYDSVSGADVRQSVGSLIS